MPRIINTRQVLHLKKGRGIDGNRLSMCCSQYENGMEVDHSPKENMEDEKKEQMAEIVNKLAKIKIINPRNSAKAKSEIKNKYIAI